MPCLGMPCPGALQRLRAVPAPDLERAGPRRHHRRGRRRSVGHRDLLARRRAVRHGLLWTALLTWPLMAAVQTMCARIGMVTGQGLTGALRREFPAPVLAAAAAALLVANTINIGADLSGMADAAELLTGVNSHVWVVLFGAAIAWPPCSSATRSIARVLKWLALALFAYVITAFYIRPPLGQVLHATFVPRCPARAAAGRRWSRSWAPPSRPYLFFWQASQEVEEEKALGRRTAGRAPRRDGRRAAVRGRSTSASARSSPTSSMFFIILTTATTLHAHGITQLTTSREVAEALRPLAGRFATLLYTLGLIGTGLLGHPHPRRSAAYAFAETFGWRQGIDEQFARAPAFYVVVGTAMASAWRWTSPTSTR